jgi:hypothetical protein
MSMRSVNTKIVRCAAAALAIWAIYRFLLRPDWSFELRVGSEVLFTWRQFWIWESPATSEGTAVGDIRWGRSLLFLAAHLFVAATAWRCVEPRGRGAAS